MYLYIDEVRNRSKRQVVIPKRYRTAIQTMNVEGLPICIYVYIFVYQHIIFNHLGESDNNESTNEKVPEMLQNESC